jgi:hypothetical protein
MTRTRRALALLPVLLLATALPGSAGTQSDPCGDTEPVLEAGPVRQGAPGERASGFDVDGLSVQDLVEDEEVTGVQVTLELCGDVPAAEVPSSSWQVFWQLPDLPAGEDECYGGLLLHDQLTADGAVERRARLSKSCSSTGQTPVLNGASSSTYRVYDVVLPASDWSVDGDTITWTVRRDAELAAAAEQVAAGNRLGTPSASTRDGRQGTLFDLEGVRASGPGTQDGTGSGPDHVVG